MTRLGINVLFPLSKVCHIENSNGFKVYIQG